ncbi:hypothetical protein Pa4123_39730 [Phytohabitans aurantiacus]|uniref:Uncharacterized protein n=1 Tax=Phytohabitans aurantiacus TaxID=3016789 RepID=A0ABQ5QVV4_9ACTN|nr:hypothetical protein Pa4123_39730 [Phytohabitans aurantiacus]
MVTVAVRRSTFTAGCPAPVARTVSEAAAVPRPAACLSTASAGRGAFGAVFPVTDRSAPDGGTFHLSGSSARAATGVATNDSSTVIANADIRPRTVTLPINTHRLIV